MPLVERFEQVGDVRVIGAWVGIEFVTDKQSITPAPAFHSAVHQALVRRGVLGITQWGKWVYRLQPALTMPPELFRWSCEQVADAIDEVAKALRANRDCSIATRAASGGARCLAPRCSAPHGLLSDQGLPTANAGPPVTALAQDESSGGGAPEAPRRRSRDSASGAAC